MATYNSTAYTAVAPVAVHGQAAQIQSLYATVALTAAVTTADVINFGYLPINARIMGATLKCTDIDTNGSPAVTFNVGDSGSATRIFSASTVGQAGTVDATMQAAGRFYKTTAKTLIVGAVGTNAATGVAGTLELHIAYVVEDSATS